jgi:hypothetical protein
MIMKPARAPIPKQVANSSQYVARAGTIAIDSQQPSHAAGAGAPAPGAWLKPGQSLICEGGIAGAVNQAFKQA